MPRKRIPFTPEPSQLSRGIVHVCYEYANLVSAAHWDMHGAAPWRTHADDAFLLGYRKIADFLLCQSRSTRNGVELPDILASDYLLEGRIPNWALPTWTREWREAMNRQLAHLSYDRDKAWVHYQWVPKLEKELRIAWQKFMDAVDPNYKPVFEAEIERCRQKKGYAAFNL